MNRLDALFELVATKWPGRAARIVCGPRELNGWHLCGEEPAIEIYDFTLQDIGGAPDWFDIHVVADGVASTLDPYALPPPVRLPVCTAVKAFRYINAISAAPEGANAE